jgi:hypothetical protein
MSSIVKKLLLKVPKFQHYQKRFGGHYSGWFKPNIRIEEYNGWSLKFIILSLRCQKKLMEVFYAKFRSFEWLKDL